MDEVCPNGLTAQFPDPISSFMSFKIRYQKAN